MYPITIPDVHKVTNCTIKTKSAVAVAVSPYTYTQQTQVYPGQMMTIDFEYPPMRKADFDRVYSGFLRLNGREGTFFMGEPSRRNWSSNLIGEIPLTIQSGSSGYQVTASAFLGSSYTASLAGGYVQIGSGSNARLHQLTSNAIVGSNQTASFEVWPKLRTAYSSSQPIVFFTNPVGQWRLATDGLDYTTDTSGFYTLKVSAVEAL